MKMISQHLRKFEEQILVSAFLRKRDEKAFFKLYGKYTPVIYQLSLRLLGGDKHAAEEAVQDSWVRAVQKLPGFRWQSSLRTWLTAITIRCCQEQNRARRRGQQNISLETADIPSTNNLNQETEVSDLEQAIANLPGGYREVLVLHDIEGYTHAEIGEYLGIKSGTSKSQLFHARNAVRGYFTEDLHSKKET